jgi:hypothetical protein
MVRRFATLAEPAPLFDEIARNAGQFCHVFLGGF